mgnify:CR=1 FL=1
MTATGRLDRSGPVVVTGRCCRRRNARCTAGVQSHVSALRVRNSQLEGSPRQRNARMHEFEASRSQNGGDDNGWFGPLVMVLLTVRVYLFVERQERNIRTRGAINKEPEQTRSSPPKSDREASSFCIRALRRRGGASNWEFFTRRALRSGVRR